MRPATQSIPAGAECATGVYRVLACPFHVRCESAEMAQAVDHVYREMSCPSEDAPRVTVEIRGPSGTGGHELLFDGAAVLLSPRTGDIIHEIDNQLSVHIARARPDLYFVHAGILSFEGRAILLAGESGAGKSTLTYALASAGLEYLSDEIAGIEPGTGLVHPYPRAICLKREPPAPLALPSSGCLRTEWTLHVAARSLSAVQEAVTAGAAVAWGSKQVLAAALLRLPTEEGVAVLAITNVGIAAAVRDAVEKTMGMRGEGVETAGSRRAVKVTAPKGGFRSKVEPQRAGRASGRHLRRAQDSRQ